MEALHIRPAQEGDLGDLADLYEAAVLHLGPVRYSPEQVRSWAAFAREEGFRAFVQEAETLVAERDGRIAGFAGLTASGRVASLYVHPDHMRRGVARRLLAAILERARNRGMASLRTEASDFSRPVFREAGFRVEAEEVVVRRGARFTRWRMLLDALPTPGVPDA